MNHLTEMNGQLYYKANPVDTVPIDQALRKFIDFLKETDTPILVGHYCKNFDLPFIRFYLNQHDLWKSFISEVKGFADTWEIFKAEFPNRNSYKQVNLVKDFLGETYEAHSALEDVKALKKLSEEKIKDKLLKYRFGAKDMGQNC